MKKIIGVLQPFDSCQAFYVYDDGKKIDSLSVKTKEIPESIYNLAQKHKILDIELSGNKFYTKGIAKKIQNYEKTKFNKQKINIKFI